MSSSSSESAQPVVGEDHQLEPTETMMVEDEMSETEGGIVNVQQPYVPKLRWSPAEDAKLLVHVVAHGTRMWKNISEQLPGRSGHACRVRWGNYLKPGVRNSPFRKKEELELMVAHAKHLNRLMGRDHGSVKDHLYALMVNRQRGMRMFPSAATAAAVLRPTATFTDSTVVSSARSSVLSRTTSAGSGRDLFRRSAYRCIACRFNWHSDVQGQRTFMADCGICRRVWEMGGHMVNRETTYMASTGNVNQSPSISPAVDVNLSLATTVYSPQPSPPPPSPSSPSPSPSPSSPPPPTFIDFLGVGSV